MSNEQIIKIVEHISKMDEVIQDLIKRIERAEESIELLSSELRKEKFKDNSVFKKKTLGNILND